MRMRVTVRGREAVKRTWAAVLFVRCWGWRTAMRDRFLVVVRIIRRPWRGATMPCLFVGGRTGDSVGGISIRRWYVDGVCWGVVKKGTNVNSSCG